MSLISTLYRNAVRVAACAFFGAVVAAAPLAYAQSSPEPMVAGLSTIPVPDLAARAWLTLDATSGQVIAANNINEKVEPASLTKIMAAYVVFDAVAKGRLSLDQTVPFLKRPGKRKGHGCLST